MIGHRIIEQPGLEGAFKDHLCCGQKHLPLDQIDQSSICVFPLYDGDEDTYQPVRTL